MVLRVADLYDEWGNEVHYAGATTDTYFTEEDDAPDRSDALWAAFERLTEQQQFVLSRLRGLAGDGHCYTLDEIAVCMGVSNQAVSRIEQRALARLSKLLDLDTVELRAAA